MFEQTDNGELNFSSEVNDSIYNSNFDMTIINPCEFIFSEDRFELIMSIIGTVICFIGIIGNIFSIIVLCRRSMKKLSTYAYLLGLSICDEVSLILTVFIWLDELLPSITGHLECPSRIELINFHKRSLIFIYPIVSSTQALSVWITLAFTVDRYLYVCKPFYGVKYCTRKRAFLVLILLLLLAIVYSIPQFFEREITRHYIGNGIQHYFINYTLMGRNGIYNNIYHLFIYCFFVTFIPFSVIMLLNGFLVFEIIQSRQRHRKMSHTSIRYTSDDSKIRADSTLSTSSCCCALFQFKKHNQKPSEQTDDGSVELQNLNSNGYRHDKPKFSMTSQRSNFNFAAKSLRNDVTLMLVGLIVVFFICQVPSTILRLSTYNGMGIMLHISYTKSLDVSNLLVVCNSTFNCILYVMLGKKFRAEFFKTFFPRFCKDQSLNNTNYNQSFNTTFKSKHLSINH